MGERKIMYYQFLCVIPIDCLYFMVGLQRGWIAPILYAANDPQSELPLTTEQCSWIASLGFISRGLSPVFTFFLMDSVGRNPILVFNALVYFSMWIVVYWSRNIFVHYIIRLIAGLSDGLMDTVASIYVCENCSPQFRGTLFSLVVLFLFAGHLIVFVSASYCSYGCVAIVYTVFGFVTLLSMRLLVEPAQYFLMKGNTEKAVTNFERLRDSSDPATTNEFEAMKKNIEDEKSKKLSWSVLRSSTEMLRSLRLLLVLMFFCAECGYPVMIAFVTKLFSNSDSFSPTQLSIVYGLLQLMSVGASTAVMERFNRRTLMFVSCSCMAVVHAATAALYCLRSTYDIEYFNSALFVLLTTFSCVYAMFMFPLIGILRGELLPQSIKMLGAGLSTFTISLASFINTRSFLPIADAFGMETNFVIFSSCALLMAVYTYWDLPETRGKTLVEIQNELKGVPKLESTRL